MRRTYALLAGCGMVAGPILVAAHFAATVVQPKEFNVVEHPTSDLGSDTAVAPWIADIFGSIFRESW